jgi:rhodanese-related sulfurtransferase
VLQQDTPIVLIAAPGGERESAVRLGRIGFDHVVGYLLDGLESLSSWPDLVGRTERLGPAVASERAAEGATVVDVRAPGERARGYIAGSVGVPLSQLTRRMAELPRDRPLVVHCAGGYRSSVAASVLKRAGFPDVCEIAGGLTAWQSANLPVVIPPAAS